VVLLYALVFARGLSWQWYGILFATRVAQPVAPLRPGPPPSLAQPAPDAPNAANAPGNPPAVGAQAPAPAAGAKVPLPPTDEPPPRNQTDSRGVHYDAQGVAVTGIDADPNGVYNVPPGRQLRIGGPAGSLHDVLPGGKLQPATRVKEWPQ
jgi:hypothetical protein